MNDEEILNMVSTAFEECPRPEHFTNYTHCCECAEHDGLLRSRNRDTLNIADVGNAGWDPICPDRRTESCPNARITWLQREQ